VGLPSQF